MLKIKFIALAAAFGIAATSIAEYRVVVLQRTGVTTPGSGANLVTTLNSPFVNNADKVGFTGSWGTNFVWYDSGSVWDNSMFSGLTGAEATIGISDSGNFIYSPSNSGNDCVWGDSGLILQETDAAPDFAGKFVTFCSRPTMADTGEAFWISGWADTSGGSTVGRMMYRKSGGTATIVQKSFDVFDGSTITTTGVGFDYQFSNDGSHWGNLTIVTGTNGTRVVRDGAVVVRQGAAANVGGNWQNFRSVNVNNAGTIAFMGDTDAASTTDDFLAIDGLIQIRETNTIDNVGLASQASRLSALDNDGLVGHLWGAVASSKLFLGRDYVLLGSRFVIGSGSRVSTDADWEPDATINEIQGSMTIGPALSIRRGVIYCRALMTHDVDGQYTAIICIPLPKVGDIDLDGEVNIVDAGMLATAFGSAPGDSNWKAHADLDFDGEVNIVDAGLLAGNFGN